MDPFEKAIETMDRIINGQEKLQDKMCAELWGDQAESHKMQIVGTSNMNQNPELAWVAPHHGEHEFEGYKIARRQVDQLDNFYFWRN